MDLTRRDALVHLATLLGATVVGPRLAAAPIGSVQAHGFSAEEIALLDEIGDTIIPDTDVPGARAVGIGEFLAMMIADCYEPAEQQRLRAGIADIAARYKQRYGGSFVGGPSADRTALLNELDREQREHHAALPPDGDPHYFRILKELTILGYFSSEIGATQALRYLEVPGRYEPDVPYTRGDRAWFN